MLKQRGVASIIIIIVLAVLAGIGYLGFSGKSGNNKLPEFKSSRVEAFTKHANKINRVKGVELKLPTAVSATSANAIRDLKIPKTVPDEFVYKGAALINLEQMAKRGVALVSITPDSPEEVAGAILKQVKDTGWEVYEGGGTVFSVKKDNQKANVKVEKDEEQTVLVVALTFKR